jgi:exopolysaccharide biosynthesis polyprenyl glycosylphosphotransferase
MGTIEQSLSDLRLVALPHTGSVPRIGGAEQTEKLLTAAEAMCDLLVSWWVIMGAVAAYHALHLGVRLPYPSRAIAAVALAISLFFVLLLDRSGAYTHGNSLLRIKETERVLRASACAALLVPPFEYLTGHLISGWVYVLSLLFLPGLLISSKQLFYTGVRALHARGVAVRRVVIYGAGYSGRRVFSALTRSPKLGLTPVAMVDDDPSLAGTRIYELGYQRKRSVRVSTGPLTRDFLQRQQASLLVIAIPSLPRTKLCHILKEAEAAGLSVAFLPGRGLSSENSIGFVDIDGLLLASFNSNEKGTLYESLKRLFDLVVGNGILIATAPLMAVLALLIRLDSPGPVFFTQQRVGKGGKLFSLYKFRSMYVDAPKYACSPTDSDDSRITRIGRFLRRTSLDELPQLLNVLKGDMSLVGPRPEMPFLVQQHADLHQQRLTVMPGLTGLWQLSADRAFLIHESVQYDLYYIRNRSFFMDAAILLHTMFFAMRGV